MPDIFFKTPRAHPSNRLKSLLCLSTRLRKPPTPLNQFDILRDALRRMRLNIAILRYNTISQVVECDMALTGAQSATIQAAGAHSD